MNAKRVEAAARVIHAEMEQGRQSAGSFAAALESARLLMSPEVAAELERLRARVAELEAKPLVDRERVELLAGFERALSPFCSDPKSAAAAVVGVRDPEVEWLLRDAQRLQDRVIELEALTPAPIQTCRVCGAGYTYGQRCTTCEFRARMAAEGYDASGASVEAGASRWSRFFAPTQAYREETQAAGVPCSKCGAPVHWVKSSNSDGGFWRHSYVPGRVLDHFGEVAESEGRHAFEKERLGESDAKRRLARCKHCGQDREAPMHAESGGGR